MTEYVKNERTYAKRSTTYHKAKDGEPICRVAKMVPDTEWVRVDPDTLSDDITLCAYCSGDYEMGDVTTNELQSTLANMSVDEFDQLVGDS